MKAIQYHRYGPPSVLEWADEIPIPAVEKNHIRIRVEACEVTKGDCELRSFQFPVQWFTIPLRLYFGLFHPSARCKILGGYIAGTVDAVGAQVEDFSPGDPVFGSTGMMLGGYGEWVSVPSTSSLVRIPEGVQSEQAAAVVLGGLNALHFMSLAEIQPGQRLLINGAGGSIGLYALQIAKNQGAHVTAVDAPHKLDLLTQAGADEVLDYHKQPFDQPSQPWDVIFNMVAGMPMSGFLPHLTERGTYLTGNPTLKDFIQARRINRHTPRKAFCKLAAESREELQQLADWLGSGDITPIIDSIISDQDIRQAHERVESEQRLGAIVLSRRVPTTRTDTV